MYSIQEKNIILGALFHDIGKFNQRCTGNPKRETHQQIGENFIDDFDYLFNPVLGNDLSQVKKIIREHHNKNIDELTSIVQIADWISAGERVDKDETANDLSDKWSHKFLSSIFTKINLNSKRSINSKYYKQEYLINENYDILVPQYENEKEAMQPGNYYSGKDWTNFTEDLKIVFETFKQDEDFDTLVNLTLLVFEKYMWCIPDFTGNPATDISLYNHLKDVCALSHSIFKTKQTDKNNKELCLIIGDIPGIQEYIFSVLNKRAAKMLRGRSAFIQILCRMFANEFLTAFDLTESSLIMLAGGKFYILAPYTAEFEAVFNKCNTKINQYLFDELKLDLSFACGKHAFNYEDYKNKHVSFGDIIENAHLDLLSSKNQAFKNILFNENPRRSNFVIGKGYASNADPDSNKIKCALTDEPVLLGREAYLNDLLVDRQANLEYEIGDKVVDNNMVIEYETDGNLKIDGIYTFGSEKITKDKKKIILNPVLEELLKAGSDKIELLRNSRFIEVANYASKDGKTVMDFETMSKISDGVDYLTLIKGDIDNLGLIMAYGLDDELTAISRTTTLSNQLKYFFSFFLNGYLNNKDEKETIKTYTIFAGGDDLMIVCHQSNAIKLLDDFNSVFKDFVCSNHEIHVSFSVTHFKHNTPIKIVSEFAEDSQGEVKKIRIVDLSKVDCFDEHINKASTHIFASKVKNTDLDKLRSYTYLLTNWVRVNDENKNKGISMGVLRNLMSLVEIMKEYREKENTKKLIWHPHLTYMINRNLKDRNGKYKDPDVGKFFDSVLSISNEDHTKPLENVLYPAICGAIYELRKFKN